MNQFKTTDTGGMPFVADDFRFMDAIYRQAINDILAGISGTDCILWGCRISNDGTFTNITEGAVRLGGELVHVAARQIAYDATHSIFVNVSEIANPDGYKKFADDNFHDTYIVREGNVFGFADTVFAGAINISTAKRIEIMLKSDAATANETEYNLFTHKFINPAVLGRVATIFSGTVAFIDNCPSGQSNIADASSYLKRLANIKSQFVNAYLKCTFGQSGNPNVDKLYFKIPLWGASTIKIPAIARYAGAADYFNVIVSAMQTSYSGSFAIEIQRTDGTQFIGGVAVEIWFNTTFLMQ